ncbi:MAG: hypothetical protein R3279_10570, partial [Putridiphycobacter sp.]|nr:hypothetical protein [Putridiphycobacter sp.]
MIHIKNKLAKVLLSFVLWFVALPGGAVGFTELQQIKKDERIVRDKVLEWADSVFYFHEDYRFENFHAHYTDEFYMVMLRNDQYKKKIEDLQLAKQNKTYSGSEVQFQEELSVLKKKYKKFQIIVDSFVSRVKYFEIIFWSNIKTKHGYPVYYAHRFKLSNDFFIM